jgi:hypothetical protein
MNPSDSPCSDIFSVIYEETLLPTSMEDPATYESAGTLTLDRECTVEDICDFVAEYINSDVLVIVYTRISNVHLLITTFQGLAFGPTADNCG